MGNRNQRSVGERSESACSRVAMDKTSLSGPVRTASYEDPADLLGHLDEVGVRMVQLTDDGL